LTLRTPENLSREIARCREMTDKPFGVNLAFLPSVTPPDYPGFIRAIIESGVKIIETAGNNPKKWMPQLKEAGITVIHKCTAIRHALSAQAVGADVVSVDGFECAGHPGEDDIPSMVLLPLAAKALKIPFIASGGFGTGAQLAAALALGAEGLNMGTRFLATKEAPVHENVKSAILAANERDTRLIMRPLRNTERVLTNATVEEILAIERDKGAATTIEDISHLVGGAGNRRVLQDDELDAGAWSCGMVAGLIHDIPTCKELIDRIMAEAEAIIRSRLEGLLAA
jgi:NADH:quinone reductase (non-electrogenic)